jgi:nucleoside-diphosphate-sugar epimerase
VELRSRLCRGTSVLVLGATGYIGRAIAGALRREGHTVYGLVRSSEGVTALKKIEVIPVEGEQKQIEKWRDVAAKCSVIIDAIGIFGSIENLFEFYF